MISGTLILVLLLFPQTTRPKNPRVEYMKRQLVQSGFSQEEVNTFFQDPRLRLINLDDPAKRIPLRELEKQILTPQSIHRGRQFRVAQVELLELAKRRYWTKEETLVALLRIESDLGDYLGEYPVLNVFYTKLLRDRKNWTHNAKSLVWLLRYCRENRIDCFRLTGSHSGAFGLTQFMPYSWYKFGVDGNGDGKIDLFNLQDAILSSANYLVKHGYKRNPFLALQRYLGNPRRLATRQYAEIIQKYAKAISEPCLSP